MDFRTTNRFNVYLNLLSGNVLPLTSKDDPTPYSVGWTIYGIISWSVQTIFIYACANGMFVVSIEKVLKDCTVNMIICAETFCRMAYMYSCRGLLERLIGKMERVMLRKDRDRDVDDEDDEDDQKTLKEAILSHLSPIERIYGFYAIFAVSSVVLWLALPLLKALSKNTFDPEDFSLPIAFAPSRGRAIALRVFASSILFEMLGGCYTITKKISLDTYTIHTILLMTAQHDYVRTRMSSVLRNELSKNSRNDDDRDEESVRRRMRGLLRRYVVVVQGTRLLKSVLSLNIYILYISNIYRLCFLSFMIVVNTTLNFEKFLVIFHTIGVIVQLYIMCFCVQKLFDAGINLTDQAFHEKWYSYKAPLKRTFGMMILANKLECRLSPFRNIDLTLPSFMQILNQAYSVCLLFLKMN